MNAPFPHQRAEREALHAANVTKAAKLAIEWAASPFDDYRKATFLDALSHCIDSDLGDEIANALNECGLDREGYATDSYGDRDVRADRVWLPVSERAA